MIQQIHAILGETLRGIAVLGFLVALFARDPDGGGRRATIVFLRLFAIVLSIQWLIGIVNYFQLPAAARPSLAHPLIMTVAVALVHIISSKAKKKVGFGYGPILATTALATALISYGIGAA